MQKMASTAQTLQLEHNYTKSNYTTTFNLSEPDSFHVLIALSGIYSIIFIIGILGNISLCIVIGHNPSMHTATNFYPLSLAISSILLLTFSLPFEVFLLWNRYSFSYSAIWRIIVEVISEISSNVTLLTITALAIERYIAICYPFMYDKILKLSNTIKGIIIFWLCALIAALYVRTCTVTGVGLQHVSHFSSFIFFVTQITSLFFYKLITIKLNTSRDLYPNPIRRRLLILVAVTLSFFLCRAPFHLQRLIAVYGKNLERPTDTFYQTYTFLTPSIGALYFLSTAINPFLYYKMSIEFRNAFKAELSSCCRCLSRSCWERIYALLAVRTRTTPATATVFSQSNFSIMNEENGLWFSKKQSPGRSENLPLQSISNFRLREDYHKRIGEKLATYLDQENYTFEENTWETTV